MRPAPRRLRTGERRSTDLTQQLSCFLRGELDPVLSRRWRRAAFVGFGSMGAPPVYTQITLAVCLFPVTVNGEPHCVERPDGAVVRTGGVGRP